MAFTQYLWGRTRRKAQPSAESQSKPAASVNPILGHTEFWDPTGTGASRHQGINTGSDKEVISANMTGTTPTEFAQRFCTQSFHERFLPLSPLVLSADEHLGNGQKENGL